VLKADDVLVADAHEHVVAGPENRPTVFLVDGRRVDLLLVLELVAPEVQAIGVNGAVVTGGNIQGTRVTSRRPISTT
jgi:hypothetical protein